MTDHVMHACPKKDSSEFKNVYGWPHDELPLNKRRHEECPYCGAAVKDMTPVQPQDAQLLNANPRGSGYKAGRVSSKSEMSALMQEMKKMGEEIKKLKGGSG